MESQGSIARVRSTSNKYYDKKRDKRTKKLERSNKMAVELTIGTFVGLVSHAQHIRKIIRYKETMQMATVLHEIMEDKEKRIEFIEVLSGLCSHLHVVELSEAYLTFGPKS
jgi:hypothetical protein